MNWSGRDTGRQVDSYLRKTGTDERVAQGVTMLAGAAILAVLWPVMAVMAVTVAAAWATGMHYARLLRAALWSVSMAGTYVIAATIQDRPWQARRLGTWLRQPYHDWRTATVDLVHGHRIPAALLTVAPVAVPAGLAAGAGVWAWRCHQMTHGLMGTTALAAVGWERRQWRRQSATAARDARQPGRVPLITRRGEVPAGTVIRVVRARWTASWCSRWPTSPATWSSSAHPAAARPPS
jgi:hypothetical protein